MFPAVGLQFWNTLPVLLVSKNYDGHGTSDRCFPVSMILGWWSGSREVLGTADKAVSVGRCFGIATTTEDSTVRNNDYGRRCSSEESLRHHQLRKIRRPEPDDEEGIVKVVSSLFTFTCGTTFFLVGVNVGIRQ